MFGAPRQVGAALTRLLPAIVLRMLSQAIK